MTNANETTHQENEMTIQQLADACRATWREQGATGEIELTQADISYIEQQIGRELTIDEMLEAGI